MSEAALMHQRLEKLLEQVTYENRHVRGDRRLMPISLEELVNLLLPFIYDEFDRRDGHGPRPGRSW